jgi:hypothetical protein
VQDRGQLFPSALRTDRTLSEWLEVAMQARQLASSAEEEITTRLGGDSVVRRVYDV